jgi:hypothetical protein
MTDYNELVNDLREYLVNTEISDALKAQAREIAAKDARIAELEAREKHLEESRSIWRQDALRAGDRIAELEALLKDCADDLEAELRARYGCVKGGPIHPAENKRFQRDIDSVYAARAALNGEK